MDDLIYGPCPNCTDGKPVPLVDGLCHWHQRRQAAGQPRMIGRKHYIARSMPIVRDPEMDAWYADKVRTIGGRCMECNAVIAVWNDKLAKAAIAHILPVVLFPSIGTHPMNFLELDAHCGCHTKWDKNWQSAQGMKVFPLAIERFLLFYPSIAPKERSRIPDIFTNYLT